MRRLALKLTTFALMLVALPAAAISESLHFPFAPEEGQTVSYAIADSYVSEVAGSGEARQGWSHRLELAFGAVGQDRVEVRITVRDVRLEQGDGDVAYFLARAVEDMTFEAVMDRGGYVSAIAGWPAAKAAIRAGLGGRLDPAAAVMVGNLLDQLDRVEGATVVGRPLAVVSALHGLTFRMDRTPTRFDNWLGGSAFIIPGRAATSRLSGWDTQNPGRILAEWKFDTDPAAAAAHLGPLYGDLMPHLGSGDALAIAQEKMAGWLADGRIAIEEAGGAAYDTELRMIRNAVSEATIVMGDMRREQKMSI